MNPRYAKILFVFFGLFLISFALPWWISLPLACISVFFIDIYAPIWVAGIVALQAFQFTHAQSVVCIILGLILWVICTYSKDRFRV